MSDVAINLPAPLQQPLALMLERLAAERVVERLWAGDPSLWHPSRETQAGIVARLGWINLPALLDDALKQTQEILREWRLSDALFVAPGGAGRIARIWRDLPGAASGAPRLTILDSIEPTTAEAIVQTVDWSRTLLVVAGASGLTPSMEALIDIVLAKSGAPGQRNAPKIVLIADAESELINRVDWPAPPQIVPVPPNVSERFAALSSLGVAPAALLGIDLEALRSSTLTMREACMRSDDLRSNPGVRLGALLGVLAQLGRDTLMLLASPELAPLAEWIATFVAGSLSKHGRGFVPVVDEPRAAAETYGDDRIFVDLRMAGEIDPARDAAVEVLRAADQPVINLTLVNRGAAAGQIVLWQVTVAVAATIIGVNPFDEPDTIAMQAYLRRQLAEPVQSLASAPTPPAETRALFTAARRVVLVGYLPESAAINRQIEDLRRFLLQRYHLATLVVDPLRDISASIQLLHAGRPDLLPVAFTAEFANERLASSQLAALCGARFAADVVAWTRMNRPFVHVDLGADAERGLRYLRATLTRESPDSPQSLQYRLD